MSKKIVLAVDILDTIHLSYIKDNGINQVVCNENRLNQLPKDIEVFNAEVYRIEGTWHAYQFIESVIDSLWKKAYKSFTISGIDIRPAAAKSIYWTNYRIGAVKSCLESNFKDHIIHDLTNYTFDNKFKGLLKYAKIYVKNNWKCFKVKNSSLQTIVKNKAKIGILVNNDFEIILYQYIFEELKSEQVILFHYGEVSKDLQFVFNGNVTFVDLSKILVHPPQKFIFPVNFTANELSIANLLYQNWHSFGSEIARYMYILSTGITKLLINVGENLPNRNLMHSVFNGKIEVLNTMNGMKSGEAHDKDINFDKWFVWDNELKKLLIEKCDIKDQQLVVTGHLAEDHIRYHQFKNVFNLNLETLSNKKVISVFSVRGKRKEKVDVFNLLYQLIDKHNDWLIIVKPHPLEKKEDYIQPKNINSNVVFIDEQLKNSKTALYDLLHLSDLSIVFGSTVALESSWIKTPCVTFEYRKVSLIHSVNNKYITHISQLDSLNKRLEVLYKKESSAIESIEEKVSEKIVKHLINYVIS